MKIGIDTLGLNHGKSSSGAYLLSMLRNLPELDDKNEIEIFGLEIDKYTFNVSSKYSFKTVPIGERKILEDFWHLFCLKKFARKNNYDIVVYSISASCCPIPGKTKSIAFVQEVLSDAIRNSKNPVFKFSMMKSLKKSNVIVVSSEFVKNDLVSLGIKKDKITVIHIGVDHTLFYPHEENDSDTVTINPFSIKRPFFIYATSMNNPNKNYVNLIKGFDIFKSKTNSPHRLVLAGNEGSETQNVSNSIYSSEYASDIFVTGHFPHQSLPDLYSCAEACVFPSVVEGVGLPVIEAMATGIPVLCSDKGALPELVENCALFFDAENPQSIADCLEKITNDENLKQELVKKGLARSKEFTVEKNARKTVEVAKKLLQH